MAARTPSRPHAIAKSMRLRRRPEFLAVQHGGRKFHSASFVAVVLRRLASEHATPGRIGFTVTKRIGNAVTRNRIRRRAREWLRRHGWAPAGVDVVFIAKEPSAALSSAGLAGELRRLSEKIATC
ncbi:MAG: ribonuclease P protein component [Kofleriaceae bacterium]|nr:ribonuclease P protein component [Kofleriaceae bacterium]MBP9166590.1 ribonuclease P protein component [Kofleriaceae bacterium]MBP9859664.1 ribonuclease P protein component [Kofleriaceae bacterium]